MKPILNIEKSSIDNRDWIYDNLLTLNKIPNKCDLRKDLQPIRDQESQGTCYAQSAACMKEWQEKKDYGLDEYLSPQFFYNNRNYWNNNIKDGDDLLEDYGMTGRDVMKILKLSGICLEKEYPYGIANEKINDINELVIESAKKHRIKSYARIYSLDSLKESLYKNGPCLIAFPVYNYTDQMWIQNESEIQQGGHAMTVVGYDDENEHFIIRNSWGLNWGDYGYCYYKYKDWNSHWECWTTLDIETYIIPDVIDTEKELVSDKIKNGKYELKSTNILLDGLILKAYENYIQIESKGIYQWDGIKYNSTFDKDIIKFKIKEENNYILTDSYKNQVEIYKKRSCWDLIL